MHEGQRQAAMRVMYQRQERELIETFRERDNASKRNLMAMVVANMVENDACEEMVQIMIDQLGLSDAIELVTK